MHHRTVILAVLALTTASVLAGCGHYSSYVDSDDSALGRVVVYRNGVAYFERKARVEGDHLSLSVPRDKVDDFLKSLTVRDANTGKAYPVSFPTRDANEDGTVDMVIQNAGDADVVLSYITESPAWKPSYRLVVDDDGKVNVQAWAIVDNTSGEDWTSVRLGVGSSSALSFRFDLRTVRNVHRQKLHDQRQFAQAPPRGGTVHTETTTDGVRVIGSLADKDIPRPADHPDVAEDLETVAVNMPAAESSGGSGGGHYRVRATRGSGKASKRAPKKPARPKLDQFGDDRRVRQLARVLGKSKSTIVIEGYARRGERDSQRKSLDRANLLRNRLIKEGVAPAQLEVKGNGWVEGQDAGVRLVQEARPPGGGQGNKQQGPVDDGDPVGESHFESKSTMTVQRGTSAMVSILDDKAQGNVVYLYDPEARRGSKRFAFKAVRFTNPTDSTLESGPVTVYGNSRFIGEGLADPIPPRSTAFVPFALDRQVIVNRKGSTGDEISRLITVQRGVLTAEVQHTRKTKLTISNRQPMAATVYVRHTVRRGWELTKSPTVNEKFGEAHLFEVALPGRGSKTIEIHEATPLTRTIDLRTSSGLKLIAVYLQTPRDNKKFEEPMRKLLALHKGMHDTAEEIAGTRERMEDYRERIDELHAQIVNLQDVKRGGQRLMRHLKQKMIEISNRLQSSTIRVVDLQQQLMLSRIRFMDGVAELSLGDETKTAAR